MTTAREAETATATEASGASGKPIAAGVGGRARRLLGAVFAALVGLFLLAPVLVTIASSLTTTSYVTFPPKGLTLHWYAELLNRPEFLDSFLLSIGVAAGAAVVSSALGLAAGLAIHRYRFPGKAVLDRLFSSAFAVPTIVLGIGLLQWYAQLGMASSPLTLLLAHLVLTVPYTVRLVLAGLAGLDRSAELAAAGLGAKAPRVFWHVTLPAVRGPLIAGAFFALITSFDDLTIALFVVTTDMQTLPVRIFNYLQYNYDPTVTAVGTVMVLFAAVAVVIIERVVGVAHLFGADPEN
ncbi:ABC transporter permease [Streptomyces sp. HNM1019]|uniref:ABC transporter permease n=1 Tax=Streptomyces sp. HNM1019 TaxID=3424717 RepID=UPI003D775F96